MTDGTVVFNQTWQGQKMKNVMVFSNFPNIANDRLAFADEARVIWAAEFAAHQSDDWTLDNLTFIYNESAPIFSTDVNFTSGALAGGNATDYTAAQTALLVSTSIVGAPPNRGRVYLTGLSDGDMTNGLWDTDVQDDAQDLIEALRDGVDYGANVSFLRIATRSAAGIITVSSAVETVTAKRVPATQRRRRQGVGE